VELFVKPFDQPLFANGRYRIVAMACDGQDQREPIAAYAVLTASGSELRRELTFDGAKAWLEDRIEQERCGWHRHSSPGRKR
jgi:hypothetical protein